MGDKLEVKFEEIIVDAVKRAEKMNPGIDPEDFLAGLRVMQLKLEERVQQARSEAGIEEMDYRGFTF